MTKISSLEDLKNIDASVGPRTGPNKRTHEQKEWYVFRWFLQKAIPAGVFGLPIEIRHGDPSGDKPEPDFVVMRPDMPDDVVALVEITEATDPADQREMTNFEDSGKPMALLGHSGGRYHRSGAARPGKDWAKDIVAAIKRKAATDRKKKKAIFEHSPAARHLIIYPNSNASILLADKDDEREAICNLREAISNAAAELVQITNGCLVHVLGKEHICIDIVREMRIIECEVEVPADRATFLRSAEGAEWMWRSILDDC